MPNSSSCWTVACRRRTSSSMASTVTVTSVRDRQVSRTCWSSPRPRTDSAVRSIAVPSGRFFAATTDSRSWRGQVIEADRRADQYARHERAALGPMHPGRVDVIGAGALILVDGAMCYRDSGPMRPMAEALKDRFAVTTYDQARVEPVVDLVGVLQREGVHVHDHRRRRHDHDGLSPEAGVEQLQPFGSGRWGTEAPLIDHLIELRKRLLWVVGSLLAAFFVVVANLIVDILYAYLDPRIRLQ